MLIYCYFITISLSSFFSQQINSQQHTPHHQLHHHGHGLGFRNSFTSMAVSLPPDLDHHYSQQHLVVNHTPNNGTSTENLQCQWHCNELPKFDIRPQVIILIIYLVLGLCVFSFLGKTAYCENRIYGEKKSPKFFNIFVLH